MQPDVTDFIIVAGASEGAAIRIPRRSIPRSEI